LGVGCCSTLVGAGGLKLTDVIPAPGYVLGILTAWVIEIPAPPRTLFQAPPRTSYRQGRSLRFLATVLLFAALGIAHSYFYGLLIGNVLLAFLAHNKTRLQLAGMLLQALVPVLFVALAIRGMPLSGKSSEDPGAWWIPLGLSLPTAGIFWALPYGKKLSWRGSWGFPYPRTTPPELSQDDTQQGPRYGILPGQYPLRGIWMWLAGWPCCLVALGLSFWGVHHLLVTPVSSTSGFFVIPVWMGVSAFNQSRKLFLRGRRHLNLAISSPNILRPGSYVLYLRSFEDDQTRAALKEQPYKVPGDLMGGLFGMVVSSRDEEEHIADALSPVGPLVAVGAPDERLPFAGAVRMYLPKTSWKQSVRQLMMRARLVTLTLGSSAGTMWELAEAMRILPPQRLLLMVPGMMRKEEYETICKKNETALRAVPESKRNHTWKSNTPPSLPDFAFDKSITDPVIGLIHFSADWEPTFTRMPRIGPAWRNLFTGLIRGLRPVFEQLVAHEEKTGWHCG
jgi:hypothetical protein